MFHDFCLTLDLFEHSYVAVDALHVSSISSLIDRRLRSLYPFTLRYQSHVICVYHVHPSTLHEKHRPTRLLLIFRSLAQVNLMHASSALQLTLGHAQTGGCTRSYFTFDEEVCPWSSITLHSLSTSLASLPFHSCCHLSHEMSSRR
jgi:hypothetical protein